MSGAAKGSVCYDLHAELKLHTFPLHTLGMLGVGCRLRRLSWDCLKERTNEYMNECMNE